jgi:acyl-CoA synthetase (AMP-forming)/AMP-acid ligase II
MVTTLHERARERDVSAELRSAADALEGQRRVAGALTAAGLAAGDRVVLSVPASTAVPVLALGALRTGVVPVVLDPSLTEFERQRLIDDADPALVVTDPNALLGGRPGELADVPLARPMHYTSGTTGRPKGVWSGVLGEDGGRALVEEEAAQWGFTADDVHLVCSPLHHSAPLRFAMGTLLAGGDIVVLRKFDPAAFATAVDEHRPTTAFVVPAHLQRLLAGPLPDLSSFRLVAHAGAPCPQPLKRQALDAFPDGVLWEFYGSTEGQFTVCSPEEWRERPGTVGRARPGRRLTTDPDGTLWCEVPPHARFTYWRDPERTAAAWRGDAFTVGDAGRLDGDGYLFLEGRRDDTIITGGVNVAPLEVELALTEVAGVREVAVFGVADERWGQRVCAAITGEADPDAVLAHARAHLAPAKRPKQVLVVAELPRTPMGKVRRSTLAADLGLS